ncbi:MAG: phosphatidylinositol-specific phospholipase C/glycerophosphodiester phosphodiesterase family protein [Prolixibacteraceae bacterium]|nr:phosphatidylinositol-specific phospholipase C/glycerophosphodiester phosphodiesterase family protein [Prolixibacteraceae bacterium]
MKKLLFLLSIFFCSILSAQISYTKLNAHSHNDYEQKVPFEWAYSAHFGSIEADIWEVNGELFVAHNRDQITPEKTLDALYIQPVVAKFQENKGKAWKEREGTFQLLIDLKTPVEPTLSLLAEKLKKYPEVFDQTTNPNAVRIVISGNQPEPSQYSNYPAIISFDGRPNQKFTPEQLKRVAIISDNLANQIAWRGKRNISQDDLNKINKLIGEMHRLNKPIRFWNSPDTPEAWQVFKNLNIDFINTDHIQQLADFLNK